MVGVGVHSPRSHVRPGRSFVPNAFADRARSHRVAICLADPDWYAQSAGPIADSCLEPYSESNPDRSHDPSDGAAQRDAFRADRP